MVGQLFSISGFQTSFGITYETHTTELKPLVEGEIRQTHDRWIDPFMETTPKGGGLFLAQLKSPSSGLPEK